MIDGCAVCGAETAQSPVLDEMQVHHSLHSLERFYSREKSLELLDRFEAKYAPGV